MIVMIVTIHAWAMCTLVSPMTKGMCLHKTGFTPANTQASYQVTVGIAVSQSWHAYDDMSYK